MQNIKPDKSKLQVCQVELSMKIDKKKNILKKSKAMMISSVELCKKKNDVLDFGCNIIQIK